MDQESEEEFEALCQRLREDLKPVGVLEEILVDQIVTTHWRLRRALKAESDEIALSVDGGQWDRKCNGNDKLTKLWFLERAPTHSMRNSFLGNYFLESALQEVRASVEQEGELTEAAIQSVVLSAEANQVTNDLQKLRSRLLGNPDSLDEPALRAKRKEQTLAHIDGNLRYVALDKFDCELHEKMEEEARQAAAVLPSPEVLDKIMRYGTMLERQLFRAMNPLERLQRRRQGEHIPAPLTMEVSARA